MASASELDNKPDARGRRWDRPIGVIVSITVTSSLASPRTIPYTMSVLAVAMLTALWLEQRTEAFRPRLRTAELMLLALLAYSVITVAWAFKPSGAVVPLTTAFGFFCGYIFLSNAVYRGERETAVKMAEGLWFGLALGVVYLGIEIASHQAIKLNLYRELHLPKIWLRPYRDFTWNNGELVAISPTDLTRNISPITLLLWSTLLALEKIFHSPAVVRALRGALFVVATLVIMASEQETSKVAIVWAALVFVIARANLNWGYNLLRVTWVLACLAVIPVTLALHRLDLQNAEWLQHSFRHRIIIWNNTSEETMKSPIRGIGAGMMYQLDPGGEKQEHEEEFPRVAPHAHNIYLQTWFELGAIGAALLTLFGLAVIERIRSLPDNVGPYAQATFASIMAITAASYGMWQPWFIAMFEMCGVMFAIAARLQTSVDGEQLARESAAGSVAASA